MLLGGARAIGASVVPRLERRTAAIVALLVVDRQVPRSKIAGLLWPDSKERTARNNLAQAIRRLHATMGVPIIVGDEALELRGSTSDAGDLLASDDPKLEPGPFRDLLGGYDFDDLPELEAWLTSARISIARAWARAAAEASVRREAEGEVEEALAWAEAHLAADPISEQAHLRVVRLHLVRGDAPAAMRAYDRCKTTLARELAMPPSPAMLEVLKAIRAGAPSPKKREGAALPPSVLRPPRVGRRAEWTLLDHAFAERRGVVIAGEPGIGKSRLSRDWAQARGPLALIEGRPGDAGIPFASLSRGLRLSLPRIEPTLPSWARRELARVLPELDDQPSEAARSGAAGSKLRLFDAITHVFAGIAASGALTLLIDDFQWVDSASSEACVWLLERAEETKLFPIVVHRRNDLDGDTASHVDRVIGAGLAFKMDLEPLSNEETRDLVTALALPQLEGRADEIARASGGYPLYVLELVRSLLVTTMSIGDRPVALPLSERMKSLVRRRLDGLSPEATRLARVAAIAGTELDVELAAHVLESKALDLADAWGELERAEVFSSSRPAFSHDVLAEAVREGVPPLVRAHTHARVASYLVGVSGDPAKIGDHLVAAGKAHEAVPHLLRAADNAVWLSCLGEAVARWEEAARILEESGDTAGASQTLYLRSRAILGPRGARVAEQLEALANTPLERARASFTRARVALESGDLETAEAVAEESATLAREVGDARIAAEAVEVVFEAQLRRGRLEMAEETLGAFEAESRSFEDQWVAIAVLYQRAQLLAARSRHREAIAMFEETMRALESWGGIQMLRARGLGMTAHSQIALGDLAGAAHTLGGLSGRRIDPHLTASRAAYETAQAKLALARGDHEAASRALDDAVSDATPQMWIVTVQLLRAEIALDAKRADDARRLLADVLRDRFADPPLRARAALMRARIAVWGETSITPSDGKLIEEHGAPELRAELACLRACRAPAARASKLLEEAERDCDALGLDPLTALRLVCVAEVALRTGRITEARTMAERACDAVSRGVLWGSGAERARRVLSESVRAEGSG